MTTSHADAFPRIVEIVVEIPRGSRNKYEYDEEAHVFRLDRILSSAVFYNFDYGFISGTRADDGDHTDALLIIDEPTFTGCRVWARPIGGLEMRDEMGFDFKVLCVAIGDPHQAHIERLESGDATGFEALRDMVKGKIAGLPMPFIILIFKNNYLKDIYMAAISRPVKRVIFNQWSYMTLFRSLWE